MIAQAPLRILIAEDQDIIGEAIRHQLEKIGHEVIGRALDGK
jgi:CheY-like chemotaxis protein